MLSPTQSTFHQNAPAPALRPLTSSHNMLLQVMYGREATRPRASYENVSLPDRWAQMGTDVALITSLAAAAAAQ
jgi:hypothetical protein